MDDKKRVELEDAEAEQASGGYITVDTIINASVDTVPAAKKAAPAKTLLNDDSIVSLPFQKAVTTEAAKIMNLPSDKKKGKGGSDIGLC